MCKFKVRRLAVRQRPDVKFAHWSQDRSTALASRDLLCTPRQLVRAKCARHQRRQRSCRALAQPKARRHAMRRTWRACLGMSRLRTRSMRDHCCPAACAALSPMTRCLGECGAHALLIGCLAEVVAAAEHWMSTAAKQPCTRRANRWCSWATRGWASPHCWCDALLSRTMQYWRRLIDGHLFVQANWVARRRARSSRTPSKTGTREVVLFHFAGCSADSLKVRPTRTCASPPAR